MSSTSDPIDSDWLVGPATRLTGQQLAEALAGMTAADGTNYLDIYLESQAGEE